MKRDLSRLVDETFDVLVVGGGILGACVAWDAASRGLKVALIEKEDFGHSSSANSMRTIHGGLRYLQGLNVKLARQMVVERRNWMRIAPHLILPIQFLLPTHHNFRQNKWLLGAGLSLYQLFTMDQNLGLNTKNRLPGSYMISKPQTLSKIPGLGADDITGGAVWHDAQMWNSERLTLGCILSAHAAGAEVANYVEALRYLCKTKKISGVRALDVLSGSELDIQARTTINCAGAWTDTLLEQLEGHQSEPKFPLSIAFNLVTDKIRLNHAFGFSSAGDKLDAGGDDSTNHQTLFMVPWRQYCIVGTKHLPYQGSPKKFQFPEAYAASFCREVNASFTGLNLDLTDIRFILHGFLPTKQAKRTNRNVRLLRNDQIYDHQKDGYQGLVTVVGVKYTTARRAAEQVVDLIFKKYNSTPPPCLTSKMAIVGADYHNFNTLLEQASLEAPAGISAESIRHLVRSYGTRYREIFKDIRTSPHLSETIGPHSPVVKAEAFHAVRREMAQTVADIIRRRTELWMNPSLTKDAIQSLTSIMAEEFNCSPWEVRQGFNNQSTTFLPFLQADKDV